MISGLNPFFSLSTFLAFLAFLAFNCPFTISIFVNYKSSKGLISNELSYVFLIKKLQGQREKRQNKNRSHAEAQRHGEYTFTTKSTKHTKIEKNRSQRMNLNLNPTSAD